MTRWDDLNARARGLGTHLLGRPALEDLAHAPDLVALAGELAQLGYPIEDAQRASGPMLELAVRRHQARRLRTLERWAGARTDELAVLFEDEDRRSTTTMVRGAVQRAPMEQRLSGLIPTPELPERALQELAAQPTAGAVAALLSAWRHPLAAALLPEAARPEPDLLRIETSVGRAFAARARRGAGRRGVLADYVRRLIDLDNACTVLVLAAEEHPRLAEYWVPGGAGLPLDLAQRAAASGSIAAAGRLLASAFAGTRLAAVFADLQANPAGIEAALLAALLAELRGLARVEPLSPAPLLAYALRLRAEALDVRRAVWGVSLGAPPAALVEGLVTPP